MFHKNTMSVVKRNTPSVRMMRPPLGMSAAAVCTTCSSPIPVQTKSARSFDDWVALDAATTTVGADPPPPRISGDPPDVIGMARSNAPSGRWIGDAGSIDPTACANLASGPRTTEPNWTTHSS